MKHCDQWHAVHCHNLTCFSVMIQSEGRASDVRLKEDTLTASLARLVCVKWQGRKNFTTSQQGKISKRKYHNCSIYSLSSTAPVYTVSPKQLYQIKSHNERRWKATNLSTCLESAKKPRCNKVFWLEVGITWVEYRRTRRMLHAEERLNGLDFTVIRTVSHCVTFRRQSECTHPPRILVLLYTTTPVMHQLHHNNNTVNNSLSKPCSLQW